MSCVGATVPDALAPLVAARAKYGADLVSLVRDNQPEQQTCGVAWVLGGGQTRDHASGRGVRLLGDQRFDGRRLPQRDAGP